MYPMVALLHCTAPGDTNGSHPHEVRDPLHQMTRFSTTDAKHHPCITQGKVVKDTVPTYILPAPSRVLQETFNRKSERFFYFPHYVLLT